MAVGPRSTSTRGTSADLRGSNLRGVFKRVDLNNVDLRDARVHIFVSGADFGFADLRGADFSGSELIAPDFSYACVSGTKFWFALIQGSEWTGVYGHDVDLRAYELSNVKVNSAFDDAELWKVRLVDDRAMRMQGAKQPDLPHGFHIHPREDPAAARHDAECAATHRRAP